MAKRKSSRTWEGDPNEEIVMNAKFVAISTYDIRFCGIGSTEGQARKALTDNMGYGYNLEQTVVFRLGARGVVKSEVVWENK